jgi:hypothetical protein
VECLRQSAAAVGDVEKLRVSCRRGYFVVHYDQAKSGNACNTAVYAQKRYQPDQWERVFEINADTLAAGDGYLAVQPSASAEVRVYQCLEGRILQAGSFVLPQPQIALGAGDGVFTVLACNKDAHTGQVGLIARNDRGDWGYTGVDPQLDDLHWGDWLRDSFWSVGAGFASATYRNEAQTDYTVAVLSWLQSTSDPRWQTLGHYPIPMEGKLPFDWSSVSGSVIGNCQRVWRYDGTRWHSRDLGAILPAPDPETVAARFFYADDVAISWGWAFWVPPSTRRASATWPPPTSSPRTATARPAVCSC